MGDEQIDFAARKIRDCAMGIIRGVALVDAIAIIESAIEQLNMTLEGLECDRSQMEDDEGAEL